MSAVEALEQNGFKSLKLNQNLNYQKCKPWKLSALSVK